ncbi:MAG: ECF transporter S component [Candidatus Micrarchaeota archaeon]
MANGLKFTLGLAFVSLIRLIPMPLPNMEPIMATMLPFARKYGKVAGFLFSFLALLSFDFISGRVGMWTVYTGIAYGIIGFAAGKYFSSNNRQKMKYYLGFGLVGTIFYDAITAFIFGIQFGQPLAMTIAGQIPFTIYHLIGTAAFILVLTPVVNRIIVENPMLELGGVGAKRPFAAKHQKRD